MNQSFRTTPKPSSQAAMHMATHVTTDVTCDQCHRPAQITPDHEQCTACGTNLAHYIETDSAARYFYQRAAALAGNRQFARGRTEAERGLAYAETTDLRLLAAILAQLEGDYERMRHHVAAIPLDDSLREEAEWMLRVHQVQQQPARQQRSQTTFGHSTQAQSSKSKNFALAKTGTGVTGSGVTGSGVTGSGVTEAVLAESATFTSLPTELTEILVESTNQRSAPQRQRWWGLVAWVLFIGILLSSPLYWQPGLKLLETTFPQTIQTLTNMIEQPGIFLSEEPPQPTLDSGSMLIEEPSDSNSVDETTQSNLLQATDANTVAGNNQSSTDSANIVFVESIQTGQIQSEDRAVVGTLESTNPATAIEQITETIASESNTLILVPTPRPTNTPIPVDAVDNTLVQENRTSNPEVANSSEEIVDAQANEEVVVYAPPANSTAGEESLAETDDNSSAIQTRADENRALADTNLSRTVFATSPKTFHLPTYLRENGEAHLAKLPIEARVENNRLVIEGFAPTFEQRTRILDALEGVKVIESLGVDEIVAANLVLRLPKTYVVQPGDSLWGITYRLYGDMAYRETLYRANQVQMPSPGSLQVGMTLSVPPLE